MVPLVFKTRLAVAERFNKRGALAKAHCLSWGFSILHILHILHRHRHWSRFRGANVYEVFTQPGGGRVHIQLQVLDLALGVVEKLCYKFLHDEGTN